MSSKRPAPVPRFTVITLGVADIRASIAFYTALGFARRFSATGEAVGRPPLPSDASGSFAFGIFT